MRLSRRRGALLLVLGVGLHGAACSGEASCEDDVKAVEACGLAYRDDVCATPTDACYVACFARASCAELDAIEDGMVPAWLGRCFSQCIESFFTCPDDGRRIDAHWQCDGEKDCLDGADERDCEYFECDSGELVSAELECDEWPHCGDRSDELRCDYFLCADNRETVSPDARCDGRAQCEDGSDERDCP